MLQSPLIPKIHNTVHLSFPNEPVYKIYYPFILFIAGKLIANKSNEMGLGFYVLRSQNKKQL